jgi:TusA-related sulfurtransferase
MNEEVEDVIDCFGDICPVPLLKAKSHLKEIKEGEHFVLVTDHSCVVQSIIDQYGDSKSEVIIDEVMSGVWEIEFIKHE